MSGQDILANSGFTGTLNSAGLGIGSTPAQLSTANPAGTGLEYAIDGLAYYKVDDATVVINLTTTARVQADLTSCLYLVQLNAAGTLSTKQGAEILTAEVGEIGGGLQWPLPDDDNCPIGGFRVVTSGGTYTPATTDLDDANVTDTYYNFAGGMPVGPVV